MKKSKILTITLLVSIIIVGLIYNLITKITYEKDVNQTGTSLENALTSQESEETDSTKREHMTGTDLYDNNLLDAAEYLGINISFLRENNLLYTEGSLARSFINAGGNGGPVPNGGGLRYTYQDLEGSDYGFYSHHVDRSVAINIVYTNRHPGMLSSEKYGKVPIGQCVGDEYIEDDNGKWPDLMSFKNVNRGWSCLGFPNYYYFNYLPNIAGVDTSWMRDKYFRPYTYSGMVDNDGDGEKETYATWSYDYSYCVIEGWREALDRMEKDGLVEKYSAITNEGLNIDEWGYSTSPYDGVPPNASWEGDIKEDGEVFDENNLSRGFIKSYGNAGKNVYDLLSPGDIVIYSKRKKG